MARPHTLGLTHVLTFVLLLLSTMPLTGTDALEVSDEIMLVPDKYSPAITMVSMDSKGDIHMVFNGEVDEENSLLYAKATATGTFLVEPKSIQDPSQRGAWWYDIKVDSMDRVHVVYVGMTPDDDTVLQYIQLSVNGQVKVPLKKITSGNSDMPSYAEIDCDGSGNVYIAWVNYAGTPHVFWTKLSNQGSILDTGMRVSEDDGQNVMTGFPTICVDDLGNSRIIWMQTHPITSMYRLYYSEISPTGTVEVAPTEVLSSFREEFLFPRSAIDGDGLVHLGFMYYNDRRGYTGGYATIHEDGTVENERRLDGPLLGDDYWPDIAVTKDDEVYIAVAKMPNEYQAEEWDIFLEISEDQGASWDEPIQLTTNGDSNYAMLAIGGDLSCVVYRRSSDVYMVTVGEDVPENHPPVASLTVVPTDPYEGDGVNLYGDDSSDPDEGDRVAEWFFDYGDGQDSGWMDRDTVTHTYTQAGYYTATLRVRDTHGMECAQTDTVLINVRSSSQPVNSPPIARLTVTPEVANVGQDVVVSGADSSDPDGSVTDYFYDFDDGISSGWTVERRNERPTATILDIDPSPVYEGREVTLSGKGEDLDGDVRAYSWESDLDGVIGDTPTLATSTLTVGGHSISFKVKDNDDEWSMTVTETLVVMEDQDFVLLDRTRTRESKADGEMHFRVTYTDLENTPPTLLNLQYARGDDWMVVRLEEVDPEDEDFTDGKEYEHTRTFTPGTWKYLLEFENPWNVRQTTDVVEFEVVEEATIPVPALGPVPVLIALVICALVMALRQRS
jgi:PKD repeat protein